MASPPEPFVPDRRIDVFIFGLALALSVGGLARVAVAQRAFLAEHPQNVLWIVLALVAGGATFLANGVVRLDLRSVLWAGYGTFAMLAGFNVQGLLNGGLLRTTPPDQRGLALSLALGAGAALSQTLGKWLLIRLVNRIHRPRARVDVLAAGLAVGLGFGLSEVLFIGTQVIQAGSAITGLGVIGIWERCAAVGFHVYSAGLLALGIALGASWPLLLVLLAHTLDDFLAGAAGTGQLAIPAVALEAVFSAVAVALWAVFRRSAPTLPG